jgi:hypothetical protein
MHTRIRRTLVCLAVGAWAQSIALVVLIAADPSGPRELAVLLLTLSVAMTASLGMILTWVVPPALAAWRLGRRQRSRVSDADHAPARHLRPVK